MEFDVMNISKEEKEKIHKLANKLGWSEYDVYQTYVDVMKTSGYKAFGLNPDEYIWGMVNTCILFVNAGRIDDYNSQVDYDYSSHMSIYD